MEKSEDSKSFSEFKEEIDNILADLLDERQKVQSALRDKNYHANYVLRKIKENLKVIVEKNKGEHIKTIADVVQLVPQTIIECFDYLENLDENIGVALNAYTNAMSVYSKSSKQSEHPASDGKQDTSVSADNNAEEDQKKSNSSVKSKKISKKRSIRKIGERPDDNLKDRKVTQKLDHGEKSQDSSV